MPVWHLWRKVVEWAEGDFSAFGNERTASLAALCTRVRASASKNEQSITERWFGKYWSVQNRPYDDDTTTAVTEAPLPVYRCQL